MKLTEEEYTDLVQKRLEYKLTFHDYCKLKKDDRIITQLILLSFEMEYPPDKRMKMQVKRKKNEYDFYNNLIQEKADNLESDVIAMFLSYPIPKAIVEEWEKVK